MQINVYHHFYVHFFRGAAAPQSPFPRKKRRMIARRSSPFIGFPSRAPPPQHLLFPLYLLLPPLDPDPSLHILETGEVEVGAPPSSSLRKRRRGIAWRSSPWCCSFLPLPLLLLLPLLPLLLPLLHPPPPRWCIVFVPCRVDFCVYLVCLIPSRVFCISSAVPLFRFTIFGRTASFLASWSERLIVTCHRSSRALRAIFSSSHLHKKTMPFETGIAIAGTIAAGAT